MSAVDKSRRNFLGGTGQLAGAGWLAMTIQALAFRAAEHIAKYAKGGEI